MEQRKQINIPYYSFSLILLSLFFMAISTTFMLVLVSIMMKINKAPNWLIGLVQSSGYLGLLFGSYAGFAVIKLLSHKQGLLLSSLCLAIFFLLHIVFEQFYIWAILRFLCGVAIGVLYVGIESWLLEAVPETSRSKTLALYLIILYLGQSLGPQLIDFIDSDSILNFAIAGLLMVISTIPLLAIENNKNIEHEIEKFQMSDNKIQMSAAFSGCVLSGFLLGIYNVFIPIYALNMNFDIASLSTALILGGFLFQWVFALLGDKYGRRTVLNMITIGIMVPTLATFAAHSTTTSSITIFFIGALSYSIYPLAMALACENVDNKFLVSITSVLLIAYGVGSFLGPILFSIIPFFDRYPFVLFLATGLCSMMYGMIGYYQSIKYGKASGD